MVLLGGPGGSEVEVVGVVGDVRHWGLDEPPAATIYLAEEQSPRVGMSILLRTDGNPMELAGSVRHEFEELDPDQPIRAILALSDTLRDSVRRRLFLTRVLAGFSILAVLLAGIGVYGVISYHVGQRTRELGLRMALGANRSSVIGLAVGQGMKPAIAGVIAGLIATWFLASVMESQLYGVTTRDPFTYVAVAVILLATGFTAALVPAVRASRVDPTVSLRAE
jgi:predicted lysophospholipase L1 biosynthesis ABC-type transport system permease subunit